MPVFKKLAKELSKEPEIELYLKNAEFSTYKYVLLYIQVLGNLNKLSLETLFGYAYPLILWFDSWAHVDTLISACREKMLMPESPHH